MPSNIKRKTRSFRVSIKEKDGCRWVTDEIYFVGEESIQDVAFMIEGGMGIVDVTWSKRPAARRKRPTGE